MSRVTALALFAATASLACGLNQEGVSPRPNTLFYPASAAIAPGGNWLFVANSNADLRYNDGTVVTLNLGDDLVLPGDGPEEERTVWGAADDRARDWPACPKGDYVKTPRALNLPAHECCRDRLDSNILNCDERAYIPTANTIRIGSFAAGMIVQSADCPGKDDPATPEDEAKGLTCGCEPVADPSDPNARQPRLFVAVRGNTSVTWATILPEVPPRLDCGTPLPGGEMVECDVGHRVANTMRGPNASFPDDPVRPTTRIPDEPYALAIDPISGLLYVGHLTGNANLQPYNGGFSLLDVGPYFAVYPPPRFINPFSSPFPANTNGAVGITSLSWLVDPQGEGKIYATSRFVPQVASLQTLNVECQGGVRDFPAFPAGGNLDTMIGGSETRGIQFAGNDGHAFVLQRSPPTLIEFDENRNPTAIYETCSAPTFLYKHDAGRGERLFVNCFEVGEIYVFDPIVGHLERTFQVGRGPAGLVFPSPGSKVVYVVGFNDNNISVVDLDPTSLTEYRVIQRIGFPSTVPR
jgi:hypothetical protein